MFFFCFFVFVFFVIIFLKKEIQERLKKRIAVEPLRFELTKENFLSSNNSEIEQP